MAQHDNNNNQPESKKEQNGRWRLGPYGHLRSGARPASIDKMKKRRFCACDCSVCSGSA